MIFSEVMDRFAEHSPASVMFRGTLENVVTPTLLDEVFAQTAKRQVCGELLFSSIVDLLALVGKDASRRHHVRFWESKQLDNAGRPLWLGAATFDAKVGFSHKTGVPTHHIAPKIDAERDTLMRDLWAAGQLWYVEGVEGFQP